MDRIVKDALQSPAARNPARTGKQQDGAGEAVQDHELQRILSQCQTRIRVVGTGGAGNNTLTRLSEVGVRGLESIAVNTDAQDLLAARADRKILIGRKLTGGLGAGSDPRIGEEAARESVEELRRALEGSDMVFITCGLGGGTGTGSAPIIAEVARSCKALTIAVVTLPFTEEGVVRWENARRGLEKLKKNADTVIVIQNDRLLDIVPDLPLTAAFRVADEILMNAVRGITELITQKGLVNLDFADVRTVMREGGTAMIGLGESSGPNRAAEAVERALRNPLLDVDITGATSALVNVTGGPDMTLKEAKEVMRGVAERLDPNAHIIWGARIDESLGDGLRVMVIATGLRSQGKTPEEVEQALKEIEITALADFDVKDPLLGEESLEAEPEEAAGERRAARVFDEIFAEECRGDIELLRQAVLRLNVGLNDPSILRTLRTACSNLGHTSALFEQKEMERLFAATTDVIDAALEGRYSFSHGLVKLFQEIPEAASSATAGERGALRNVKLLTRKMEGLLRAISQAGEAGAEDGGQAKTEEEKGEDVPPPPDYSSEEDAVRYIMKLFDRRSQ